MGPGLSTTCDHSNGSTTCCTQTSIRPSAAGLAVGLNRKGHYGNFGVLVPKFWVKLENKLLSAWWRRVSSVFRQ